MTECSLETAVPDWVIITPKRWLCFRSWESISPAAGNRWVLPVGSKVIQSNTCCRSYTKSSMAESKPPIHHHKTRKAKILMSIPHAQPGDVIDVRPLADQLATSITKTLIKTSHVEVIRMVLPAGKLMSEHKAPGEIIVQCLEGDIKFTTMGEPKQLRAGDMLYLTAGESHELEAVEDSSFLLTILFYNSKATT